MMTITKSIFNLFVLSSNHLHSSASTKPLHAAASTTSSSPYYASIDYSLTLDEALKGNSTAAQVFVDKINDLRSNNEMTTVQIIVDDLIPAVMDDDNVRSPFWTRFPFMTQWSKRARKRSLYKTLNLSTPQAEIPEDDSDEAKKRRYRNSFLILMRNLSQSSSDNDNNISTTSIRSLEKLARKEANYGHNSNLIFSADELVKRTPTGLETPKYEVIDTVSGGRLEVRRYEPYSVATVGMNLKRNVSEKTDAKLSNPQLGGGASSFGALAGYLFGKNEQQTAMKMTTPVFSVSNEGGVDSSSSSGETGSEMSFVLPSDFWGKEQFTSVPVPLNGSGVSVRRIDEPKERAVLVFGGFARKPEVMKRKAELMKLLKSSASNWEAIDTSSIILAQYNDPFTVPWKRRNEVAIEVVRKISEKGV